jgi:hypothetical protein
MAAPVLPGQYLIAIDPGQTTGVCTARYLGGRVFQVLHCKSVKWDDRFKIGLGLTASISHVVIEEFRLFGHRAKEQTNSVFPSVRVIGMVETCMYLHGILDRLHFQQPGQMKGVEILPGDEVYMDGTEHTKDAYRHMRGYILRNRSAGDKQEYEEF